MWLKKVAIIALLVLLALIAINMAFKIVVGILSWLLPIVILALAVIGIIFLWGKLKES